MNPPASPFVLHSHEVHLWHLSTTLTESEEKALLLLLNEEEVHRADRFRFPIHRQRFIAARANLRKILSAYLQCDPKTIQFSYSARGKPYLPESTLQFNVSHSEDMAVYALTPDYPIGVDIELTKTVYDDAVAARFFSAAEYASLCALPEAERVLCFYRIWSRKEAMIKVTGEGLAFALSHFSVPVEKTDNAMTVSFNNEAGWTLQSFTAHPGYQSAYATAQTVEKVIHREWKPPCSSSR